MLRIKNAHSPIFHTGRLKKHARKVIVIRYLTVPIKPGQRSKQDAYRIESWS